MKLLHLLPSTFFGGPEKQILLMAQRMRTLYGHGSSFLIMPQRGHRLAENEFVQKLRADGFAVRESKGSFNYDFLGASRQVRAELTQERPDVLLSYGYKADLISALVRRPGCRKIAVVHGWTGADRKVRLFEALDRVALRAFERVVVISRSQVELLARYGLREPRVVSIPNAIDVDALPKSMTGAELKERLGIQASARIIGSVGRLSFEKGHAVLVRAFSRIRDQAPDAHLVLVGDGPEEGALRALARDAGVVHCVHFAGFQKDGGTWIGGMDLFVLPSFREALPLVVLEAFAYRTPMIGTDVGDVRHMVRDGETGRNVAKGEVEALGDQIASGLADPAKGRAMAIRAHEELLRDFTPSRQAERWQALLTGNRASS